MDKITMPNNNYIRGIQQMLESRGYITMRSAGSKSPFDVIALNESHILLIQVKTIQSTYYPNKELDKLRSISNIPPNARKEIWVKTTQGTGKKAKWRIYTAGK